jgi:UDP-N-acetylglucosamine 2-epimerase
MRRLKVMTVVGTRPELIRLSRVIAKLDESPSIEHILVHTGQNYDYELNQIFFEDLEIRKPDHFLESAGKNSSETIGQIIIAVDKVLENIKPDAFLVLGDTNSCLCAIPAKKKRIPIFHMEAGNRCFDQRVPEETNRRIVDHISDINLTYSDIAREYLLREGLSADRIIKTGSPMFEVLHHYEEKIRRSDALQKLGLKPGGYFLLSSHREENVNDERNFKKLVSVIQTLCEIYNLPVIVSTHPRTRKVIEEGNIVLHPLVQLAKPFGFCDYNSLQLHAKCVLSDSGTISEEASILNFPALNLREAHERPEAMEEAAVMMVGMNAERVIQGIDMLSQYPEGARRFRLVNDYAMPNVGDKVVRIIISYTDYVKRVVWQTVD